MFQARKGSLSSTAQDQSIFAIPCVLNSGNWVEAQVAKRSKRGCVDGTTDGKVDDSKAKDHITIDVPCMSSSMTLHCTSANRSKMCWASKPDLRDLSSHRFNCVEFVELDWFNWLSLINDWFNDWFNCATDHTINESWRGVVADRLRNIFFNAWSAWRVTEVSSWKSSKPNLCSGLQTMPFARREHSRLSQFL